MKAATSSLACSWSLPRPIIKSHQKKIGCGHGLGELPKIECCFLIFLQRLKLSTAGMVLSLGLPRPIKKSHPDKKWTKGAPKIWRFPFTIYTMAKDSDFKFGTQLGFAKACHKITSGGKVGVALG